MSNFMQFNSLSHLRNHLKLNMSNYELGLFICFVMDQKCSCNYQCTYYENIKNKTTLTGNGCYSYKIY